MPIWVVLGICTIAAPVLSEQSLGDRICNPPPQQPDLSFPAISSSSNFSPGKPIPYSTFRNPYLASKPTTALGFYTQATEYYYYSDPTNDEKIAFLNKAIVLLPNYIEAYRNRAELYAVQNRYDLAIADYDRLYQLDPSDEIRLLKNKAYLYSLSKQWEKLIQTYDRLLTIQPQKARSIHLIKARAYSELKDWDSAVAEYSRSIKLSKDRWLDDIPEGSEPSYISEPLFSRQSIEPNPSLTYIPALNTNVPDDSKSDLGYFFLNMGGGKDQLYVLRARIYAMQGKKTEAITDYTNAIRIARINKNVRPVQQISIYRERCKNLVAFRDLTRARADAQVANELDAQLFSPSTTYQFGIPEPIRMPDPKVAALPIGMIPPQSKQTVKKPKTLKELMETGTSFLSQTKKTEDYQYANEYADAIDLFTQAIALDRNYAPAYYSRGLVHIKQKNLQLAIADFSEAIRLNPEFSLAYSERASAHQENGEPDQALKDFDLALKADPTLASANLGRGLILLKQQQWKSAAHAFTQTLEADPEMLEALEGRSIARKNLNDLAGSLTDQTRAKRIRDR